VIGLDGDWPDPARDCSPPGGDHAAGIDLREAYAAGHEIVNCCAAWSPRSEHTTL
jgi:hypothetical protein